MAFRDTVVDVVTAMLTRAGFPVVDQLAQCIVTAIDSIHSYTEEGVRLYPEVLITTALSRLVQSLPSPQYVEIGTAWPMAEGLAKSIKRCAPLARDGWVVAVEVTADMLTYGVLSVESSELSSSLYSHSVGQYALPEMNIPAIYLRGLGGQRVEIKTRQQREMIAVSLREMLPDDREITALATSVSLDVPDVHKERVQFFFAKLLGDALRNTHGCLVGVVRDRTRSVNALKRAYADGAYLKNPIDFVEAVAASEQLKTRSASMALRNYSSVLRGMLSHDGITVLSSKGRVIGYNIFVPRNKTAPGVAGGARSRAFDTLSASKRVICCLSISHDGGIKLWRQANG